MAEGWTHQVMIAELATPNPEKDPHLNGTRICGEKEKHLHETQHP